MKTELSVAWLILLALGAGCKQARPAPAGASDLAETPQELAAQADIPLYPGAQLPEGKSNLRSNGNESRYEIVMITPDPVDKVSSFYKHEMQLSQIPDTKSLMGYTKNRAMAKIDIGRDGSQTRIVAVSIRLKS